MRNLKIILILTFSSFIFNAWSQAFESRDITLNDFYSIVQMHHPIAQQALLLNERGGQLVKQARGIFDPKFVSDFNRKNYYGKNYYETWDSYVKVPTLLNIDLKAGYERNQGQYLNAENTVPGNGLYYAGISVPLGQGLIYNERNINLQKSKFEKQYYENDANNVLNNLFLDANYTYWWWYENYKKNEIVSSNLRLIQERFEGIRQGAISGENATIDSVEMLIQVQQWSNELKEAELNLQNSVLLLQNFIWTDSLNINGLLPIHDEKFQEVDLEGYINWALSNHPNLKELTIESSILELDRKLSVEQLKPIIDVNYNVLLSSNETINSELYTNNYKMGVQFAFPLLVRKERAKLNIVKIKQQEYDLKITQKNREVLNKIQQSYNKVFVLHEMILQQDKIQANYELMLRAELTKFDNGESSIFLINSRENKKLLGQIKLIELQAKYNRAVGELKWATGKLYDDIMELSSN